MRKSGQEVGLGPRIGSDLMSAIEHGLLMGSHLGRLLRKAPFTAVHPNQAILSTCPLFHGALARHGEVISSLGSSVNEKESRVEKGTEFSSGGVPSEDQRRGRPGVPLLQEDPQA